MHLLLVFSEVVGSLRGVWPLGAPLVCGLGVYSVYGYNVCFRGGSDWCIVGVRRWSVGAWWIDWYIVWSVSKIGLLVVCGISIGACYHYKWCSDARFLWAF